MTALCCAMVDLLPMFDVARRARLCGSPAWDDLADQLDILDEWIDVVFGHPSAPSTFRLAGL